MVQDSAENVLLARSWQVNAVLEEERKKKDYLIEHKIDTKTYGYLETSI